MPDPIPPAKTAQDYAAVRDWPGYFHVVLGKPPRETLLKALALFDKDGAAPGLAADVGCGEGRDTLELLRRGWRVLAIDEHPAAFAHLSARVPPEQAHLLDTRRERFDTMRLPPLDLVSASFSLPFCEPQHFPALWHTIQSAIRPGGRFAGQLFGDRDSWAVLPDRSHQSRPEVEQLLRDFNIEMFDEEERDSKTITGEPKHWHVFHIVARKR